MNRSYEMAVQKRTREQRQRIDAGMRYNELQMFAETRQHKMRAEWPINWAPSFAFEQGYMEMAVVTARVAGLVIKCVNDAQMELDTLQRPRMRAVLDRADRAAVDAIKAALTKIAKQLGKLA
jgi:hypothetical protein